MKKNNTRAAGNLSFLIFMPSRQRMMEMMIRISYLLRGLDDQIQAVKIIHSGEPWSPEGNPSPPHRIFF
jgi:hypothetical protein